MRSMFWLLLATMTLGAVAGCDNTDSVGRGEGVTGTWDLQVDIGMGPANSQFGLEQVGGEITGEYRGAFGIVPLTGTVTGRDITLGFTTVRDDREVTVKYVGTVDGDTMSGTVSMPAGNGTFTGLRQ